MREFGICLTIFILLLTPVDSLKKKKFWQFFLTHKKLDGLNTPQNHIAQLDTMTTHQYDETDVQNDLDKN